MTNQDLVSFRNLLSAKKSYEEAYYRTCREHENLHELSFVVNLFFLFQTALATSRVKTKSLELDMVASFLICKTSKTIGSIAHLCRFGLEQDAAALLRNLSELLVTAISLCDGREKFSLQRYLDFDAANCAKKRNAIQDRSRSEGCRSSSAEEEDKEKRKDNDSAIKKFKNKYGKNISNWYGTTFQIFAKECDAAEPFVSAFSLFSDVTHSSLSGARSYMVPTTPGRYSFSIDPDFSESSRILLLTASSVHEAILRIHSELGPIGRDLISISNVTKKELLYLLRRRNQGPFVPLPSS